MSNFLTNLVARSRSLFESREPKLASAQDYNRAGAGVTVNEDSVNSIAAVWCATRAISEDIAGLPWIVSKESITGEKEVQPSSRPLGRLLNTEPNPIMDAANFRALLISWALLWGDGFAEIERDAGGRPVALWPVHPQRADLRRDRETNELVWFVANDGADADIVIPDRDMFHLMGPSPDGKRGWSVVTQAKHTFGLSLAAEQFGSEFFANGAHLSGVLKHPSVIGPEAKEQLRKSWAKMYSGSGKRNRFAILEGGLEWQSIGIPPDSAQFLQTRKFQIEDIARWFRVPPHKLMDLTNATYSNITNMERAYVQDALIPWMVRLEQQANKKLTGQPNITTSIDASRMLRGNPQERASYYKEMSSTGVLTVNEIRKMEGLNPIGPEGDERYIQKQYVTIRAVSDGLTLDNNQQSEVNDDEIGSQDAGTENRRNIILR